MKKLVVITGLTGTGKSDLAIEIAKQFNGEIISADSVQIYRQLNIGSAKVTKAEMQGIQHHLIDIKDFNETYNVGQFVHDCMEAVQQITNKGKLPIICGGTGLYIKALLEGYTLGECANIAFRQKYEQLAQEKGNQYVWQCLNDIAPEKAKTVHCNNIKRVIRYLELATKNVEVERVESPVADFDVLCVGIVADREEIYAKLNKRVDMMLKMGLEDEINSLISQGATRDMQAFNSIDYKEWFDYFDGKQTKDKTIELIKQHNRNYCKRQLTFLKTIKGIELVSKQDAETKIKRFLND